MIFPKVFRAGESFVMEEIEGSDYIVYVPPRWYIPGDGGSYMRIRGVWDVLACVRWVDDDGGMQGSFGECWESKEWKKSPCASFWLIDGTGEWSFFTTVKNDDVPMREYECYLWVIIAHILRVGKYKKMLL